MTIAEERTAITGGVDAHSEVHVGAALDPLGGLPGGGRAGLAVAKGRGGLSSLRRDHGKAAVDGGRVEAG